MSKPFKVLISGGGIAGSVLAFWLARASTPSKPIHIRIIEKASSVLKTGQGIDVEGPAKEIVTRMGLLDTIKARTTGEQGFRCIDNNNRVYTTFERGLLTREIEIMRGDLCEVLTNAVNGRPNVELQYSRQITDIVQMNDKVRVTISKDGGQTYVEEYNAVIASDGVRSKTRDLMLDPADIRDCVKSKDLCVAFFSVPAQPQDKPYARFQHALGGRSVLIRPVTTESSSVYLNAIGAYPALKKPLGHRDQKLHRQA